MEELKVEMKGLIVNIIMISTQDQKSCGGLNGNCSDSAVICYNIFKALATAIQSENEPCIAWDTYEYFDSDKE